MDEKNQGKKPGNPWTKSLLIWVAVLFGLVLFVRAFDSGSATQGEPLAYSEFVKQVDEGNVQTVTIATSAVGNVTVTGKMADGKAFRTVAPGDANVSDRLIAKGVGVAVKA
ncbi:MAG: ATP-dependent metallopeptidase FtsH/Yme1/Tma family protein, partial [Sphingomicrobium sp.]